MRARWSCILALFLAPHLARAQELALLGGMTEAVDPPGNSYGWQLDYRHNLADHFALSAAWINEGHPKEHRRDGIAAELWGRVPLFADRISFAFGGGAYHYFDTQSGPGGGHLNAHGWSPIYSLSATWYTKTPWFARLAINHVHPPGETVGNMYLLGIGYRLWAAGFEEVPGSPAGRRALPPKTTRNEVMLFLGDTVHNTADHKDGIAGGVEFRRGISEHLDWTLSWINEDNHAEIRRNGLGSQLWLVDAYSGDRLTLGFGAGVYAFLDRLPPHGSRNNRELDIAGLATLTTGWRFADRWFARFNWNRVVANDERDSDIFVLGIGRRWEG